MTEETALNTFCRLMNLKLICLMTGLVRRVWDSISYGCSKLFHDYHRIIVLGMPSAGKTRFLCQLNGKEYEARTTAIEEFEYFSVETETKNIYIDNGLDIGGTDAYLTRYIEFIESSDIVFFVFNIKDYLYDEDYQRKTNARLDIIYTCRDDNKKCCIIGSHYDVYQSIDCSYTESTAFQAINAVIFNETPNIKEFRNMFKDNKTFFIADLTKKDVSVKIVEKFIK